MDNGLSKERQLQILAREKAILARKNKKRLDKEAATPIVKRPSYSKRKKKVYQPSPVVVTAWPAEPVYVMGMKQGFYQTREWRSVRYDVLKASDGKCALCGRSKQDGIVLHVDHIKPRSKYPDMELAPSNMQVLCEDCNMGKSNKDW